MQLVILAAGMGSRFGGLKQMEPMDDYGNFLLDYSIYDAKKAGFSSVVFIIKHEFFKEFKETIGARAEKIIKCEYAFQELDDLPEGFKCPEDRVKPWGTAHAIFAARDLIKENFIIINGDDFYGFDTYKVAHDYIASLPVNSKGQFANVGFKVSKTMTENGSVKRGVLFEDENGFSKSLIESSICRDENGKIKCSPLDGSEPFFVGEDIPVSMNLFCFDVSLMDTLRADFPIWLKENINVKGSEYLIPTVVDEMTHKGIASMKVLKTDATWFGVTYKEDKPGVVKALKDLVDAGEYKVGLY